MTDTPEPTFPDHLTIKPLPEPPHCTIRVPGSKSITNRALILAALAQPLTGLADHEPNYASVLTGVLHSEDTEVMVAGLQQLGITVYCKWSGAQIAVKPSGGRWPKTAADIYVANSGTTMRFLTALVSLGHGRYRLDGVPRMRERPIQDLLSALAQLGVRAYSENNNGCPPVTVEARGLPGGTVRIRGDVSSQFLSGLLMAAPLAQSDMTITVEGPLVSRPYVAMTVEMMRRFGAAVNVENDSFHIPGRQQYRAQTYAIEPDASAASYFAGAAAICGGEVQLAGLTGDSLQGDMRFLEVLEQMGCAIDRGLQTTTVRGQALHGVEVDMNDISDTVMTLAAVACFADSPTTIRNVAHIRHKETDRLAALATELRRLGAEIEERPDGLTIRPHKLHGAEIETYNDHRMAMSLALIGLRVPAVIIKNPACVAKTYPGFFADLETLSCRASLPS